MAMDPWATKNVLGKNITTCGFNRKVSVQGGGGLEVRRGSGQEGRGLGACGDGPLGF